MLRISKLEIHTLFSLGGVHHWDENGLRNPTKEPAHIRKIHIEIVEFVLEWLKSREM